ncbi:hypothetical protein [Streptomyces sp. NPDC052114]|uniref:hypothetical protein n=1 Tax=unclassified Streptomyces TaxID=2593676 RepID=UPI00344602D8
MPQQHDRTTSPTSGNRERGVAATAFIALRRHRRTLASATARVVGLSGLAGLLMTAAIFACAWPLFTHMRNQRAWYHHLEDPYLHDHSDLGLVALYTLPLFLVLLGIGGAALQVACSRAVAEVGTQGPAPAERIRGSLVARLRPLLAVYALRGLIVWPLPLLVMAVANSLTGDHLDTPQPLERGSWPYTLVAASPAVAVFIAVLLRLALTLAPAAVADGLGPRAALRRSWQLTWTRAGLPRVLVLAVPSAALIAGLIRLATQLALPLRPLVRSALEQATGNFFAAYYAGILAPVIVGLLVAAAVMLPLTFTAFAALYDRLYSLRITSRRAEDECVARALCSRG